MKKYKIFEDFQELSENEQKQYIEDIVDSLSIEDKEDTNAINFTEQEE